MLRKPHWTLGLELGPHHFQFQDRYHEELVARRFDALFDYAWGIREVEWDLRALGTGRLALRRLEAIFPDGTPVTWRDSDGGANPAVVVRELGEKNAVDVYAGLRRIRPRGNVEGVGADVSVPRFVKDSTLAADLSGTTDPVRVDWLRPNLQLLLEGAPVQEFDTIACARVVRTAAGALGLDEHFVPPVLTVRASSYLEGELRRALAEFVGLLSTPKRANARDATEAVQRWIASLLGSLAARLSDVLEQGAHPIEAYRILAELLGGLGAFTPHGQAMVPPFDYEHLGPVFNELLANLAVVLDALTAERHRRIALRRVDPATLYAELKEPAIFRNEFYLGVSGTDVESIRAHAPQQFKIAAWSELPQVIRFATSGVALQPVPRPPSTLPAHDGTVYFRVEKTAAFTAVFKTGQLGIHHGPMPGLLDVALFAVEPDAA